MTRRCNVYHPRKYMVITSSTSNRKDAGQGFILKKMNAQKDFKLIDRMVFKLVKKDFILRKDRDFNIE